MCVKTVLKQRVLPVATCAPRVTSRVLLRPSLRLLAALLADNNSSTPTNECALCTATLPVVVRASLLAVALVLTPVCVAMHYSDNVRMCPGCTRLMYGAGWNVTSTPLDTCGVATLQGPSFNAWVSRPSPLASVLAQSYLWWTANCNCWCVTIPHMCNRPPSDIAMLAAAWCFHRSRH